MSLNSQDKKNYPNNICESCDDNFVRLPHKRDCHQCENKFKSKMIWSGISIYCIVVVIMLWDKVQ